VQAIWNPPGFVNNRTEPVEDKGADLWERDLNSEFPAFRFCLLFRFSSGVRPRHPLTRSVM
jgi:hypothetical protein